MAKSLTEMTVEILTAQLSHRDMSPDEIDEVLKNTFSVLKALKDKESRRELQGGEIEPAPRFPEPEVRPLPDSAYAKTAEAPVPKPSTDPEQGRLAPQVPPMEPMDSIQQDKIVCLECGREFKQISHTHLRSHGLTPKEYRNKYRFPTKQPLTARSLSEKRKQKAKEIGLGVHLKTLREAKQRSGQEA